MQTPFLIAPRSHEGAHKEACPPTQVSSNTHPGGGSGRRSFRPASEVIELPLGKKQRGLRKCVDAGCRSKENLIFSLDLCCPSSRPPTNPSTAAEQAAY